MSNRPILGAFCYEDSITIGNLWGRVNNETRKARLLKDERDAWKADAERLREALYYSYPRCPAIEAHDKLVKKYE